MIDFAPELVFEVVNDCTGCGYCLGHLRAAKSVERFDFEMFAQREDCLFWQKRVAVILKCLIDLTDLFLLFRADQ